MEDKKEDIFSDKFAKKSKEDEVHDVSIGSDSPPKKIEEKIDDEWRIPKEPIGEKPKKSKKTLIVSALIIGIVVGGIVYAIEIALPEDVLENLNPIELGESVDKPIETPVVIPQGSGGTKDVSSASDKVELEKTNDPIGYYMVTTNDDWYGDYVDIRKIPNKIEQSGSMKLSFRCYTDDFQGTSTYFATFRNVLEGDLTVEVYINGLEVETQTTDKNRALIVEGSCYGHES